MVLAEITYFTPFVMRPLLADPDLAPTPEDIARSAAMAQDLLDGLRS